MKKKFYSLKKDCLANDSINKRWWLTIHFQLLHTFLCMMLYRRAGLFPLNKVTLVSLFALLLSNTASADYTIATGNSVNASTLTGQTGLLTVNGTLYVNQNVSLTGFTAVIVNGQIYWNANYDLKFSSGISFDITDPNMGMQPTAGNGNASTRLYIGTILIAVSSDNSQNAAFSFHEFNVLGGLPRFTINTNSPVCIGNALSISATPSKTSTLAFNYNWTISPGSGTFNPVSTNSTTITNTTISPSPGDYTVTCTVSATGDLLAITTQTVSVNLPVLITAQPSAATSCFGSVNQDITVTATGTSPAYQWQVSTTGISGTYADLSDATPYSGVTDDTLNLIIPPIAVSSNFYRVLVSVQGCGTVNSNTMALRYNNVWMGTISTSWNNAANWSGGILPSSSCTNIYIPNQANQPVLNSTPVPIITNLVIDSGATLTVANAVMKIGGSITNNGIFDATNGTLEFNGTSGQNTGGSVFKNNIINSLIVSNTSVEGLTISGTVADSLNIIDSLSFGSSNSTLNTGNNIWLRSTANSTARVTDITRNGTFSSNNILGTVTVQRYLPAIRAWRLVTSPLSNTGSIYDNWQNRGNYIPGMGILVTGLNPTGATGNGLDQSPLNNSSLKIGVNLIPVQDTKAMNLSNNTNVPGQASNIGYFLFIRGDRDPANTNPGNSNVTTINSKGTLQTGSQSFPAATTPNGFSLIGNPYASPVNFLTLTKNNIANRFYAWDPRLNSVGGYVLVNYVSNTFTVVPPSLGGQDSIIQSGQSIFIQTLATGAASIVFNENNKSAKNNRDIFRPASTSLSKDQSLLVNLYQLNTGNTTTLADGTMAEFNAEGNGGIDIQDAPKFPNVNETVSLLRDAHSLALEQRPRIVTDDTLFLQLAKTTQRSYRLELVPANLDPLLTVVLEDSYTGIKTVLNSTARSHFDFVVDGNAGSVIPNRFRIIFKHTPLPVIYPNLKASPQGSNIEIEWTSGNVNNTNRYEIEKSADGVDFAKTNTITATIVPPAGKKYNWLDASPLGGTNYYRVRSNTPGGSFEYSSTVMVKMGNTASSVRIYPNPVSDGIIGAEFINMAAGDYLVRLINTGGQPIFSKTISHVTGTSMEYIKLGYKPASGTYWLEITAPGKETMTIKSIVK